MKKELFVLDDLLYLNIPEQEQDDYERCSKLIANEVTPYVIVSLTSREASLCFTDLFVEDNIFECFLVGGMIKSTNINVKKITRKKQ